VRYDTITSLLESPDWPMIYKQQASRGLIPVLRSLPYPAIGIEVGVNRGLNSWYMLQECPNISKIIGVDHYQPYVDWDRPITMVEQELSYDTLQRNLHLMGDRFQLIREHSQAAAKLLDDDAYDFVFIDGGHSMKQVLCDLDSWVPKVRAGGVIAGHDSNLFSVNFAVTSWVKSQGIPAKQLRMVANDGWYWQKN
jgi:predicted O-methyltransferase YrrM